MNKEILYHYFSGEATEEEKKQIAEWLNAAPEHVEELKRERKFYDLLLFVRREKRVNMNRRRMPENHRWIKRCVEVAVVVLIMLGGVWGGSLLNRRMQQKELLASMNTISVPPGQQVSVTLVDGTKIWLNANSELQYPAFFAGNDRRVKLSGEAFFSVTHDETHPFIVETQDYHVKVLGTQFNVEAYPGYGFITSLQDGKVCVVDNQDPEHQVFLKPGEQAVSVQNRLMVQSIHNMDLFRWKEGLICFENVSFQALMQEFEKSYGIRIIVKEGMTLENEFSGKLRISDGVEHAFRVLQSSAQFTYSWDTEKNIIYIDR